MSYNQRKLILLYMAILIINFILGISYFNLWSQVIELWVADYPLEKTLMHPHGLRYLIVYPIFYISNIIDVNYDSIFNVVGYFCLVLSMRLLYKNINSITTPTKEKNIIIFFVMIFLSIFMHGRVILAVLGSLIIISTMLLIKNNHMYYFTSVIGLALSSVSSGTFTVALVWFLFFWLLFKRKSKIEKILGGLIVFGMLLILMDFISLFVKKNVDFYGGGVDGAINMLNHGMGRLFFVDNMLLLLLSIIATLAIFISVISLHYLDRLIVVKNKVFLFVLLLNGGGIGLFGVTTMIYSLPLVLIIALSFESLILKYNKVQGRT